MVDREYNTNIKFEEVHQLWAVGSFGFVTFNFQLLILKW